MLKPRYIPKTIGIIGGKGKFGSFFAKIFRKDGYKVIISDIGTRLSNVDVAKKADVVIVSVPINITSKVIEEIVPYVREDAMLTDFTSLKEEPIKAMLKSRAEVVGMHPMFGPSLNSLKNQVFVLCPVRPRKYYPWLRWFILSKGAKIKITTPKKHDEMMSIIQVLIHFSTIITAEAIKELGININESLQYTSPVYRLRMDMIGRIFSQDASLYADIEMLNRNTGKIIDVMEKSLKKFKEIILSKDRKRFIKEFNSIAKFLGTFKRKAAEESKKLVETIQNEDKEIKKNERKKKK